MLYSILSDGGGGKFSIINILQIQKEIKNTFDMFRNTHFQGEKLEDTYKSITFAKHFETFLTKAKYITPDGKPRIKQHNLPL